MRNREIDAKVMKRMLDRYLETAMRYARSPADPVMLRRLNKDFANLSRLRLHGSADWLQTWGEFTKLHRMSLRIPKSAGIALIPKLVVLKNNIVQDFGRGSNVACAGKAVVALTVPMATGRRSSRGSHAKLSSRVSDPAAVAPDEPRRAQTPVAGLVTSAQHQDVAAPPPRFEKRHLTAQAPSVVASGSKFCIIACIDVAPAVEGSSAPLAAVAIPERGLMVTIETIAEGNLRLLSSACLQIRVLPGKQSSKIEIALQATALGSASAVLRARTDHAYLGDLRISMLVASSGAPDLQEVKSGIAATAPMARRATLAITYSRPDRTYRFMLFGDAAGLHEAELVLDEDLDALVPKLMAQANGLARGNAGYSKDGVEKVLTGIGAEMWKRLLPDRIKAVLAACWDGIDRLDIVSNDDMLPWELLFAYTTGGPDMGFVSDKWLVTRWRFGAGAPLDVGAGPPAYVVPSGAPQAASDEVDALRKIFPSDAVWKTVDELNKGIRRPGMGLLHIAAHNSVRYGDAAASFISLDKPFPQSMLGPQLEGVLEHRPLVFINACASAAPTVQWQGATSWAARFLTAGAGAFIGSNWEVRDGTASDFAKEFYTQAQKQQPLGLAFQRARAQNGGLGDPTRFAYSYFGHPDAVLQTQGTDRL